MSFVEQTQKLIDDLSACAFNSIVSGEQINLNFRGENTDYLRFNQSKVRQSTQVQQLEMQLTLQKDGKKASVGCFLSSDFTQDQQRLATVLARARAEASSLPTDPYLVPMTNNGTSQKDHQGSYLQVEEAMKFISETCTDVDMAGFYGAGPVIRANQNSLGQKHWFSTDSFFVDYSLFTKNLDGRNKAVKGLFSSNHWNSSKWSSNLQEQKNQLSLMRKPEVKIKPGTYRAFLAPSALHEVAGMLSWNALSFSALKNGGCAFKELFEGKQKLSPKFHLKENFKLGSCPQFNGLGEIAPDELHLIEKGELKNMLISSRAAKEYGVTANGSDLGSWGHEYLRSPEILPGGLRSSEILPKLGTGLYLGNLHYLNWSDVNKARITGMTRYACFWVENGEIVAPIQDIRFDESLYRLLGSKLEDLTDTTEFHSVVDTYHERAIGGKVLPGLLAREMTFTL